MENLKRTIINGLIELILDILLGTMITFGISAFNLIEFRIEYCIAIGFLTFAITQIILRFRM